MLKAKKVNTKTTIAGKVFTVRRLRTREYNVIRVGDAFREVSPTVARNRGIPAERMTRVSVVWMTTAEPDATGCTDHTVYTITGADAHAVALSEFPTVNFVQCDGCIVGRWKF